MALHHELPIYKAAFDFLSLSIDLTRNIPRDFKRSLGDKVRDECVEIMTLIFRANVVDGAEKVPYIKEILERTEVLNLLLRVFVDKQFISKTQYAKAIAMTGSIGKQAGGWKKHSAASPASGSSRRT